MNDAQSKWNSSWLEKANRASWQPDPWLTRILPLLSQGSVLDIACGMGRNAIFLAELGYAVTAVDISKTALELLKQESIRRSLVIEALQIDLEASPQLPAGPFDVLLNFLSAPSIATARA